MSTLYLVGTPIGNLEDISLRALRVLREVTLVGAEDTRHAKLLFAKHGIGTRLVRYDEQGQRSKAAPLLEALVNGPVAFISDAGMPSISDPGFALVNAARQAGHKVEVIPGPSAVLTALALSGLPSEQFTFLGFLPRRPTERRRLLEAVKAERRTLIAFEAPHRLQASLRDLAAVLGERELVVCRELTKVYEEVFRGTPAAALAHFVEARGEFTLVIAGASEASPVQDLAAVHQLLAELRRQGLSARQASAVAAPQTGLSKRELYQMWIKEQR